MCGRYYVEEDLLNEIRKVTDRLDENLRGVRLQRDIHPTETAPVIFAEGGGRTVAAQSWGFPGFGRQKIIFNARAESALEKKLFRESVLNRRCVIPVSFFYEWNPSKEKFVFRGKDKPVLYLAGFHRPYEDGERFVILTTEANESVKAVHQRMPLVLDQGELGGWLEKDGGFEKLLKKKPGPLERTAEYEQEMLPFL